MKPVRNCSKRTPFHETKHYFVFAFFFILNVILAYRTVWLSNQVRYGGWGTPVTVIAEEVDQKIWFNSHQGNTLDTEYYDGELINRLQDIKHSDKMLIVVHLMGNHTSYHSWYPVEFDRFKEQGKRSITEDVAGRK